MKKELIVFLSIIFICYLSFPNLALALPVFPSAEGGGAESIGGRGGKVIEVTNLNNSGTGSLRACIETFGPRTCVFRISGTINLLSRLRIINPYLTIAGQSAPGGGIIISGKNLQEIAAPIMIYTHDVNIRFIRVRTGKSDNGRDCIALFENSFNVIVDHCSLSWSLDENMQAWSKATSTNEPLYNVTFSWSISSEGLADHSCGFIAGNDTNYSVVEQMENIDVHHNLFIHNQNRNPLTKIMSTQIINNLIYNWRWWATGIAGGIKADIIGNFYKKGLSTATTHSYEVLWRSDYCGPNCGPSGDPSIFIQGNAGPYHSNPDVNNWIMIEDSPVWNRTYENPNPAFQRFTPQTRKYPITVYSLNNLEKVLLPEVGASYRLDQNGNWVANRDSVDERLIEEYKNGVGTIISDESESGGFPTITTIYCSQTPSACYPDTDHDGMSDTWEQSWFGNLNQGGTTNSSSDFDGDGYTDLEEFLNGTNPKGGNSCFGQDNQINTDDVLVWLTNYLFSHASYDVIQDDKINTLEFSYLLNHWGESCSAL